MLDPSERFTNFWPAVVIHDSPTSERRPMTSEVDANKRLVSSFVAAWNDRDFDRFEGLMGDDAVLEVGGNTVPCDPAGTRAIAREWTIAFPGASTFGP
jgi:hypothetical protein